MSNCIRQGTVFCYACNKTFFIDSIRRIKLHNKYCSSPINLDEFDKSVHNIKNMNAIVTEVNNTEEYLSQSDMLCIKCNRCKSFLFADNFHKNRYGKYNKCCSSCLDTQLRINNRSKKATSKKL